MSENNLVRIGNGGSWKLLLMPIGDLAPVSSHTVTEILAHISVYHPHLLATPFCWMVALSGAPPPSKISLYVIMIVSDQWNPLDS